MKIRLTHPLISCICITDNRPSQLLRSIILFDAQSYPNRELVISYKTGDQATKQLIEKVKSSSTIRIVTIERHQALSLGMAKNEAISKCHGEYICIWDDYNWFHTNRLMHQYNTLQIKAKFCQSSLLKVIIVYNAINHKACLSTPYDWAESLLCKKSLALECQFDDIDYLESNKLIAYLRTRKLLYDINDAQTSFIYVYKDPHSQNYSQFSDFLSNGSLFDQYKIDCIYQLLDFQLDAVVFNSHES